MKIGRCARCGKDHEIEFKELGNPIDEMTHWGLCENTQEPVLMRVEHQNRLVVIIELIDNEVTINCDKLDAWGIDENIELAFAQFLEDILQLHNAIAEDPGKFADRMLKQKEWIDRNDWIIK